MISLELRSANLPVLYAEHKEDSIWDAQHGYDHEDVEAEVLENILNAEEWDHVVVHAEDKVLCAKSHDSDFVMIVIDTFHFTVTTSFTKREAVAMEIHQLLFTE